jgi:uncharacterized protein (UPF0276 family)
LHLPWVAIGTNATNLLPVPKTEAVAASIITKVRRVRESENGGR